MIQPGLGQASEVNFGEAIVSTPESSSQQQQQNTQLSDMRKMVGSLRNKIRNDMIDF